MTTVERISASVRDEWGDSPRECVLSLKLVGKKLGVDFGYFFLAGGDLPEVVCNWAGASGVSAVYDAIQEDVQTDLPVLLRRHDAEGNLKELENKGDHKVEVMYALNVGEAFDPESVERDLSKPIMVESASQEHPLPRKATPPPEADDDLGEASAEKLVRGFAHLLHYIMGEPPEREKNPLLEEVYALLPEDLMEVLCRRVRSEVVKAHQHSIQRLQVGMAVVPTGVDGLPPDLMGSLWEGGASPLLLVSWVDGPDLGLVEETCTKKVDTGGVPLLLYRYGKGEPLEVDPLSMLRSGKVQGRHRVTRGAQN